MEEMPEKPVQEIAMAIVGPFINLAIAAILYLLVGWWSGIGVPNLNPDSTRAFVGGLIGVNIWLAIFNLMPAFPMDGGRVLRGLLGLFTSYVRATAIAVAVGQVLAMLMIFLGLMTNWWLALIGFFIYMGAGSEKQQVLVRSLLRQVGARHAMVTEFESLHPDERLAQVVERVYHGCQDDFPVVGDAGLEGILTRNKLLAAIHEKGLDVPVSEVMTSDFVSVEPTAPLDEVYRRLSSAETNAAAVVQDDRLVGLIAHDTIGRFLAIRAAVRGLDPADTPAA
jgi:CBS domain-containing protein